MNRIHPRLRRPFAFLGVLALGATACTSRERPPLPEVSLPSPGRTAATAAPAPVEGGSRLVVVAPDGNLVTMRPDGSEAVALTDGASPAVQFLQPTWSPDGRRVAWVALRNPAGAPSADLVTATVDGTGRTEARLGVAAFYLSWDPTSSRVAYLGSAGPELELGLVDVRHGGTHATPLGSGSPFYFSWAPDGRHMLVHADVDRLETLGLDGTSAAIGDRPGRFDAPVWSADGKSIVYASIEGGRQHLVVADAGGGEPREVVDFDTAIRFELSADSARLAYEGFASEPDAAAGRGLQVLDLHEGKTETVSRDRALAFFWSPAGDRLLFLLPEVDVAGAVWLRWNVWDGRDSFATPRFRPSATFAQNYLPFFDQYAQSLSLWAPDGSAFAYPGVNEAGEAGIWVQPAKPGAEPVRVAAGVFAAWSPR